MAPLALGQDLVSQGLLQSPTQHPPYLPQLLSPTQAPPGDSGLQSAFQPRDCNLNHSHSAACSRGLGAATGTSPSPGTYYPAIRGLHRRVRKCTKVCRQQSWEREPECHLVVYPGTAMPGTAPPPPPSLSGAERAVRRSCCQDWAAASGEQSSRTGR